MKTSKTKDLARAQCARNMCDMNLTLSISDDVLERAREVAHQQGTSVNTLVRQYLEQLAGKVNGSELAEQFATLWEKHPGHSGGGRFDRAELYEERLGRGNSK